MEGATMSNRELCIEIINGFEENQLENVAALLQSLRSIIAEAEDDAFCLKLANDYDGDADKGELMSIHDFSKELGIELE
jgi:hypothetical protein